MVGTYGLSCRDYVIIINPMDVFYRGVETNFDKYNLIHYNMNCP